MNRILLAILSLATCGGAVAQSSTSEIPPPSPPFVATVGWGYKWSAKISYDAREEGEKKSENPIPAPPPADSPMVASKLEVRLGRNKIIEGTVTYQNGSNESYFISQGSLFQKFSNSGDPQITSAGEADGMLDAASMESSPLQIRVSKFPGVNWISLKNYTGVKMINSIPCYSYQTVTPAVDGFSEITRQAWIRVEDKFPIRARVNSIVFDFSPVETFPDDVALPEDYLRALKRLQAQKDAMEAMKKLAR